MCKHTLEIERLIYVAIARAVKAYTFTPGAKQAAAAVAAAADRAVEKARHIYTCNCEEASND